VAMRQQGSHRAGAKPGIAHPLPNGAVLPILSDRFGQQYTSSLTLQPPRMLGWALRCVLTYFEYAPRAPRARLACTVLQRQAGDV
jgi:hypothetical protein